MSGIGDLTKPATVLAERCCDAIQGGVRPWQIRRVAEADGDARIIAAKADVKAAMIAAEGAIKIDEVQRRALTRFVDEQTRQQVNMEEIAAEALGLVYEDARPEEIEADWITNFFAKARLISDKEMQALWAKVLAGEANSVGKFSKRAVALLESMDKRDAECLVALRRFTVLTDDGAVALVYHPGDPIYTVNGLSFRMLQHLDSIGFLSLRDTDYFRVAIESSNYTDLNYFGAMTRVYLTDSEGLYGFESGKVLLSRTGQELISIVDASPVTGFLDFFHWHLKRQEFPFTVESDV